MVGAVMVNFCTPDTAPPGFSTMTLAAPAVVNSEESTSALSCVPLTIVVGSGVPFQTIADPAMKFDPVAINWKAGLPADAVAGLMALSAGTSADTVIVCGLLLEPPGFTTVTNRVPVAALSCAPTCACSWVAERKVVGRVEPLTDTEEPFTKLAPT